jgi:hypothetical protein
MTGIFIPNIGVLRIKECEFCVLNDQVKDYKQTEIKREIKRWTAFG